MCIIYIVYILLRIHCIIVYITCIAQSYTFCTLQKFIIIQNRKRILRKENEQTLSLRRILQEISRGTFSKRSVKVRKKRKRRWEYHPPPANRASIVTRIAINVIRLFGDFRPWSIAPGGINDPLFLRVVAFTSLLQCFYRPPFSVLSSPSSRRYELRAFRNSGRRDRMKRFPRSEELKRRGVYLYVSRPRRHLFRAFRFIRDRLAP